MQRLTELTNELKELAEASSDQIADIKDKLEELRQVIGGNDE